MVSGRITSSQEDKGAFDPELSDHIAGRAQLTFRHAGDRITFYSEMASFKGDEISGSISAGMDGQLWFQAKRPDGRDYRCRVSVQDLTDAFMAVIEEIDDGS